MLVAPIFQIVQIGTQLTEAVAGLERTREILAESARKTTTRDARSRSTRFAEKLFSKNVDFAYEQGKTGSARNELFDPSPGR